jgi:Protein of unknown function (DUF3277)
VAGPSFDTLVYDADRVLVEFAGQLISKGPGATGYADGAFLKIEPTDESFVVYKGTDGTITRSKTNQRGTKITILLSQSSASNDFLSTMLNLDETQPNGAGIGTLLVQDLSGTTLFTAQFAWVVRPANQDFDRTATAREWELFAVRDEINVGSN